MSVYAMSDLHGHYEIYEKVKAMLKPEDKVYFLGDAGDRGPDSWKCIKAIYDNPQFIYIKGNHEDMLVDACQDYLDDGTWNYNSYMLSYRNGGEDTMEAWEHDPNRVEWVKKLRRLPLWEEYTNPFGIKFILCHAGFTPWIEEGDTETIIPDNETLLWDREHYYSNTYLPQHMEDVIIVHGHTPIHHLADDIGETWLAGAFWYCGNHKICIDSGGFFSDEFVLLNLDTLEDIVLTLDKKS